MTLGSSELQGSPGLNPGLTGTLRVLLYAVAAFSLASFLASLRELSAFDRLLEADSVRTVAALADAERLSEGFAQLAFWVGVGAGGATILWWYRAYRAVEWAPARRWSRRWAVGGWFIPLANLVIPKLVLNEIDRASRSEPDGSDRWRQGPTTPLAHWWWGAWVAGLGLTFVGTSLTTTLLLAAEFDSGSYRGGLVLTAAGFAVSTAAAFLGAASVRIIGGRLHSTP